jgi:predicted component of type VI protein secretion system
MAPQTYQLVMEAGPTPNKAYALERSEIYIGRDIHNEVVINDAEVSRRHARLVAEAGSYLLEDLGSTNGSFVDGLRIAGPHLMRVGEKIYLGENVVLRFDAAPYDPDATMASAAEYAPPSYEPQPRETYMPRARMQEPAYSGQVPPGPEEVPFEAEPRRNLWLWAGCGCLVVLICVVVLAGLWYIDSNFLWCEYFPFLPGC